jgi:hypothetical protein
MKGLKVVDCPKTHAAYPGKMLVADKRFSVGEEICIYAGIMSRMPVEQLKLNESDYMSTVCNSACGPYGFELEDVQARSGCVFKAFQRDLPTVTPRNTKGLSIPNALPPADLSSVKDIKGIGPECTRLILDALPNELYHDMLCRLFRRLNNLPDKQWKQHAQTEIKRTFARMATMAFCEPQILIKEELEDAPISEDVCNKLEEPEQVASEHYLPDQEDDDENIPDSLRNVWTPSKLRAHISKSQELVQNRTRAVWD